ncbi:MULTISPECIES: aminopeptidase N [Brachybacterium]|uniref:Aminopeptidase N n=2 Tax=Brachybacterium TaxID=43668 RepID=A0A3R8S0F3_9MICO|nr:MULTISPECIES: aminopeptidase N [Brachybacterium]RRR20033.1 aminopeptidase N [Brachybacterium paraconglomeratum]GLI31886.1 aminopeptidase N [Brachybacterium conglomeratum]GLK03419.1 aminopeptidase N [Brachybacterium conglomeratum]
MSSENLTRDEARRRASFLSTDAYEIRLDLTTDERTFRTETALRFDAAEAQETFLDLIAEEVHEIELNGELLPDPASRFDGARVHLPALAEGANTVRVLATGRYMNTGEGLHRFVDPVDDEVYLYTQFEVSDARRMFACFEQPDLKATYQLTVTAPDHWRVISNSPTPEPSAAGEGTATWAFSPTERISTYLVALIAGNYQGGTGEVTARDGRTIPMGVFARASLADHVDAQDVIDVTRAGIEFYEEAFDQDFPFRKYDQVFVPEYNMGAMENPGAITYVESYVFRSDVADAVRERRDLTILHELAHMWFGDLVTMRWWDDLWLNESFAEYASTLASAEVTHWDDAWTTFALSEKSWAYQQDQLPSTHPIVADMVDLEAVETNFDGITYAKGASVLRQLVAYVGREEFFAGVRAYFAKHAWGNTELSDLLTELEATSGRNLARWAQLWLQRSGVNTLAPVIEHDADGAVSRFAIRQTAPAEHPVLRPHRLQVGGFSLQDGKLVRTETLELDVDGELTEVPELAGRRADLWLLNDGDLTYTKVRLDADSLAVAMEHLRDLEDPLARTLLWSAAWDMVRDAELPSRRFQQLVLANLTGESSSSVVRTLLQQLESVAGPYAAAEERAGRTEQAADAVWALAQEAEAGSDTQLQLLESFARLARTTEHRSTLEGLLGGGIALPGREIDTDLRWKLVISLAVLGGIDAAGIDEQLAADDTQSGRKHALTARAALPTEVAKAKAWRRTVEKDTLANESVTAVVQGFRRVTDETLIAPYRPRYFEEISRIWAERSNEIATRLVSGYFPHSYGGQGVLDAADQWLADSEDAPFGLRRIIIEGRDTVARQERVRAADVE